VEPAKRGTAYINRTRVHFNRKRRVARGEGTGVKPGGHAGVMRWAECPCCQSSWVYQGHFWSRIDICSGRTRGCLMSHGSPLPAGSFRLSVNVCGTPRGSSTSNS
jgi:hypothetical protein